jgi:hypothetical protein
MGGTEGNEMKVKILTQMPITPLNILQFSGMKVKILTQMPITPLYILQIFKNESDNSNVIIKLLLSIPSHGIHKQNYLHSIHFH